VQGGLHHLPRFPDDLIKCLEQIQRVLKPNGLFVMVEPWLTPFLSFAHRCCRQKTLRILSNKLDALAIMVEEEQATYNTWLSFPEKIKNELNNRFIKNSMSERLGKINFVGSPIKI
jgi:ubiquinone/menaquinone biosynthesis C-methylase UbiE